MESVAYIALSRQTALLRQMDVVANNIANAGTAGFRGEHMLFAEHVADLRSDRPMSYVEDLAVIRDTQPGHLVTTGNDLDLAIQGDGYFVVETPAGSRYTRGGTFQLNADREIITSQGYPLLDEQDRPINVPAEAGRVTVTRDGTVFADGGLVARIRLAAFADEQALRKTMGGLYITDQAPQPAEAAQILQGRIEQSNVQPVVEMTRMMEVLRSFQATQNMLDAEHERKVRAIRELPSLQTS